MGFRAMMRGGVVSALLLGGVALTAADVAGQSLRRPREIDRKQYGFGYVVNAPEMMGGVGAYVLFPPGSWGLSERLGAWGIYVDAKFDLENPSDSDDFEPDWTAQMVLDSIQGNIPGETQSSWMSLNVALVRPVNPYLNIYAGGGYARRTKFRLYEDPSGEWDLGRADVFWVESPSELDTRFNMMVGIMMRLGPRISSQFGIETQPRGVNAGVTLRLPAW